MTLVPVHHVDTDVAIVGAGFAGAILAQVLRQRGLRVALLERGRHPRFVIGESSTPLAGLLIEELADRYDLPRLRPLASWGTWKREYPDLPCGLKRGFSFFRHDPGQAFRDDATHVRQLLVAASPHDEVADTHWYRPAVDAWLTSEAEAAGATYLDACALDAPVFTGDGVTIDGTREGRSVRVSARFLVDASGPRGYLWRALGLGDAPLRHMPPTQALFTHFTDVREWAAVAPSDARPPYPVDAAALHHVWPGAWMWVLRFDNGITSAGVAATDPLARGYALEEGADGWMRLLAAHPSIAEQFRDARPTRPFVYTPRVAHRTATVAGARWALLPSAAGVVDPMLSTGFPLALLGIDRLASVLTESAHGDQREAALRRYARDTVTELGAAARLVGALYANMRDFDMFKRLTLLYFAAASYTETVRRLDLPHRARGFLLRGDRTFAPAVRAITRAAVDAPAGEAGADVRRRLADAIDATIAPYDVAGLGDRTRRDWYPVSVDDIFAARERLGVSEADIGAMLERCGIPVKTMPVEECV
ncbi:MAG: tryptophan 7-halogenase [Acidobacteria bacterium]|nr:tryptophan 7-halogenase [Acidobacteriota bacterium]